LAGWSQVVSLRRKGIKAAHLDWILGSGEFVEGLLSEAGRRGKDTLRLRGMVQDLGSLAHQIVKREGIGESELRSRVRQRKVSQARCLSCHIAGGNMGYLAAEVARILGVTTSAVIRAAYSENVREIETYL